MSLCLLTDFAAHHQVRSGTCMSPQAKPVRLYKPQDSSRSVRLRWLDPPTTLCLASLCPASNVPSHPRPVLWSEAVYA